MEAEVLKNGSSVLAGEDAFKLYDTYGFPLDLTKEILEEKNITIDEDGLSLIHILLSRDRKLKLQKENFQAVIIIQ